MKHIKLVMLGILTSSLYASGFYGGVDIGAAFAKDKIKGIAKSQAESRAGTYDKNFNVSGTNTRFTPGIFAGYEINSEANGGG